MLIRVRIIGSIQCTLAVTLPAWMGSCCASSASQIPVSGTAHD
jgi:hypothetical protein